ncbi:DUF2306 domain-containing protein [Subsaximicrobium wynnwilliamsii]|uniref:DUF2306 domain-containing protein n=1 Tax=Subsaximicrobium wynnwilliamsii TaxID=291179 RepID=UPI001CB8A4DC|nr:DUF2306 domain-containing protein [Subsaximicrobium wynnwilliamsii]
MSQSSIPERVLGISTTLLFVVIFLGQFIFALYILGLYGISGLAGDFERWNTAAPHGYDKNDITGNIFFGMHMALAAVITIGGPLQLIKGLRNRFRKLHRISGRIYITCAFLISLAGFYLVWVKGSVGGLVGSIFISFNGTLIFICAFYALKKALNKQFSEHQKWAIRLFLVMSGVWFFRVFLMLWLTIFKGPVGFDPIAFQGPALVFLYMLSYLCPILLAEYYFRTVKKSNINKVVGAVLLLIITVGVSIGSFAATMGLWLPNIK